MPRPRELGFAENDGVGRVRAGRDVALWRKWRAIQNKIANSDGIEIKI